MAKITQLYETPPHGDNGMKDYKEKLFRHRAGMGARFLMGAVVVLGTALAFWFWFQNKTYAGYEVLSSSKHTSTVNTEYAEYNGNLLKYSKDGISCISAGNEALWSQTYNMQNPMVDICKNAVAIADRQGNEVYVFQEQGLLTKITTLLPIQQVSISAQGVTALLLNDSTVSWICLYDKEGKKLTESRCSLDETGQPLSISISSDGTKLAVSYLQIQNGTAGSCVVFYNFGSVGSNFVDKIVSSKVYEDTIIPRVKYLGNSACAAVSDQGIFYYEGAEIPEEKAAVPVEQEIYSIFFGENKVGVVTDSAEEAKQEVEPETDTQKAENAQEDAEKTPEKTDEKKKEKKKEQNMEQDKGKYHIRVFDTNGKQILSKRTDMDYEQIRFSGKSLLLYDETQCEIYNEQGVLKYTGSFEDSIAYVYKGAGICKYRVVFSDRTDTIRLQ